MRTSSMIASMAAVVVAGSANAAIVYASAPSGGGTNLNYIVITSDGSFLTDPTLNGNNDIIAPTVAYTDISFVGFTAGGAATMQPNAPGYGGTYGGFQFFSAGTGTSTNPKVVVNNAINTEISTLGTGWTTTSSFGDYILNGSTGLSTARRGQFYNTSGYIGFRFGSDGAWYYGWAKYTAGTDGNFGTLSEWAYNDVVNGAITAGQVPAPGAIALLGAAGLVGARRRR